MSIADVKKLSLREKFQLMEILREDLRGAVDEMEIPQSHKDLLDSRRDRVSTGKAALRNWDDVKDSIRKPC